MTPPTIPTVAQHLGLAPHPEGGWYRRTYTAETTVETTAGPRPAATLIHFYLAAGEASAWHAVTSDEIWLWHGPGELAIQLGGTGSQPDGEGPIHTLGTQPGGHAQVVVPADTWQRTLPGTQDVLVSCLVTPGFSFDDWKLAD